MKWGNNSAKWVRPLRNVMCLLDGQIVEGEIDLGYDKLIFNDKTCGHRFMAPEFFKVKDFKQYKDSLLKAYVVLDQNKRREIILNNMTEQAESMGHIVATDKDLLDEVTGLVEWPVVLMGNISERFMKLPKEVLVTSLKVHQKYFTINYKDGSIAPYYFIISNIEAKDGGKEIIKGNGRVLAARLSDAEFFYSNDQKKKLEEFLLQLSGAVFHVDLGSMSVRIERMQILSTFLAEKFGENIDKSHRAAELSKADLMTEMVGEFANLQGIMGCYYAKLQGEDEQVSQAILEHYKPKGPSDSLPSNVIGQIVAISDKIDMLVGFFSVGIKPTGSKDPFALRRSALGLIRILENYPNLILEDLITKSYELHQPTINKEKVIPLSDVKIDIVSFVKERSKVHWRDQDLRHDYIDAILSKQEDISISLQLKQIKALDFLMQKNDGKDLVVAYKRAANIVRIEEEKSGCIYKGLVDKSLLKEKDEISLFDNLQKSIIEIKDHLKNNDYIKAMHEVASLKSSIDLFFENVIVNSEDLKIRENRLNILSMIRSTLEHVAQFEKIEG